MKLKFKIVTPEKIVYEKEIDQVTLPTSQGQITILPNHLPLVAILVPGELIIKNQKKEEIFMAVAHGFIEVGKNEIRVLTETAERAEEIDELRAQEARLRAQKLLQETKNKEMVDYTALAAKLAKETARLKVAKKKKYSPPQNFNNPR